MAGMFDGVSGRYDLINRLMTLGLDDAWREVMWRQVPEGANVVVDLCTGNGISADGMRRTGRTVLGVDVSLRMLEHTRDTYHEGRWAPRFTCADAFRLPLADGSVDAVTVAFGLRNLRPRAEALAEISRVLRAGGVLAVLEATAPGKGALAPLHRLHVRAGIPLLGRLSPDPGAYRYLSESIFEFGDGRTFEVDLLAAGFEPVGARSFMLGAARLWVVRRVAQPRPSTLQNAAPSGSAWGDLPKPRDPRLIEWRLWNGLKLALALAVLTALILGFRSFLELAPRTPVAGWERSAMRLLLYIAIVFFALRSAWLALRFAGPPRRR
jgi:demethylmenaquinone methyltransferase/2-methoxy-6-polyprenyl-1,4-benzoquinol methylase